MWARSHPVRNHVSFSLFPFFIKTPCPTVSMPHGNQASNEIEKGQIRLIHTRHQQAFLNFYLFVCLCISSFLFKLFFNLITISSISLLSSQHPQPHFFTIPHPLLLLSLLQREGLPWISRHHLSYWGWTRRPSRRKESQKRITEKETAPAPTIRGPTRRPRNTTVTYM